MQMIAKKYKKYPEYKDSGIECIANIPFHWTFRKFKLLTDFITCGLAATPEYVDKGVPFLSAQNVQKEKLDLSKYNFISEKLHKQLTKHRKAQRGDILQVRVGAGIGNACIVDVDFEFSVYVSLTHLRLKQYINNRFVTYILNSSIFKEIAFMTTIQGGGVGNLNVKDLERFMIPFPCLKEQNIIANFLDRKTARLDGLIEKKQQLIELLKEKRQAIISHAVTKGLDKNVKLKPSGLDWIGEIPEHWTLMRLQFVADLKNSNVDKKSYEGQKQVSLCNYTDVYYKDFITNDLEFMQATASDDEIKKFTLNLGDIIITKDSESPNDIAVPAIIDENIENLVCGYHLTMIKPKQKMLGKFLFYCFKSDVLRQQFYTYANGITRYGLSQQGIKIANFPFVPSIDEQQKIVDYIDEKTSKTAELISKIELQIEKLKEYKQALISNAVTGKIDVREAV